MPSIDLELNSKQSIIWDAIFDENGKIRPDAPKEISYWGAYRCGKSLMFMLICYIFCRDYPGINVLYCRATYGELEDSVIRQFIDLFPPDLWGYRYLKAKREGHFPNGSIINFRAFDKDKKILSNEYDLVIFCQAEEIAKRLFLQVIGRLSGQKLPKNFLMVEGNPEDDCWPTDRYITNDPPEDCLLVQGSTYDNEKNLPPNYIATLIKNFPANWISKYVFGNWDKKTGLVYDEFRPDIHVIPRFDLPDHWYKIIGFDHGTVNPSAMDWLTVSENRKIYIWSEYYERKKHNFELAEANKKHGLLITVGDYTMKVETSINRSTEGSTAKSKSSWGSTWADLLKEGMRLTPCTKDKKANILLVNSLFKQNRLYIFDTCVNTIREHRQYMWKPNKVGDETNSKEEVIKKNDHTCDAVQYAIRYLKDKKVFEPTPYPISMTLEHQVKSTSNTHEYGDG